MKVNKKFIARKYNMFLLNIAHSKLFLIENSFFFLKKHIMAMNLLRKISALSENNVTH